MSETRYERIAREQAERQAARADRERGRLRDVAKTARLRRRIAKMAARGHRLQEAAEIEAEYAPDSFDPPDAPQF